MALYYREGGIGLKLVRKSFELAKNLGDKCVFVVGDSAFYNMFSFKSSALFGIRRVPAIPDQFVMIHKLSTGALSGVIGTVTLT